MELKRKINNQKEALEALDALIAHGWIRLDHPDGKVTYTRPS